MNAIWMTSTQRESGAPNRVAQVVEPMVISDHSGSSKSVRN